MRSVGTLSHLQPLSLMALLATLVLLFGFQGEQLLAQPIVIAILAVPILIQVYLNAGLAYVLSRHLGVAWCVAGPAALIGASNFFELAVAAAISIFGLNSGAALATVVGVLVEVPVMLSVVKIAKASRGWYEAGTKSTRCQCVEGEPMTITIYHNPDCGTSRNILAMIRQSGEEPEIIEYLKTPPSRTKLIELLAAMAISPRNLLRDKGTPYRDLGLDRSTWSDDELIDQMLAQPILINRASRRD
jgi:arsenate reductase (glutaredoxin)